MGDCGRLPRTQLVFDWDVIIEPRGWQLTGVLCWDATRDSLSWPWVEVLLQMSRQPMEPNASVAGGPACRAPVAEPCLLSRGWRQTKRPLNRLKHVEQSRSRPVHPGHWQGGKRRPCAACQRYLGPLRSSQVLMVARAVSIWGEIRTSELRLVVRKSLQALYWESWFSTVYQRRHTSLEYYLSSLAKHISHMLNEVRRV